MYKEDVDYLITNIFPLIEIQNAYIVTVTDNLMILITYFSFNLPFLSKHWFRIQQIFSTNSVRGRGPRDTPEGHCR